MNDVLKAFEAIRNKIDREDRNRELRKPPFVDIYAMAEARFTITTRTVSQAEAEAALTRFQPEQGWVCRQSSLEVFAPNEAPPDPSNGGVLLSAELVGADANRSLHLRQNGMGDWLLSELCEGDAAQGGNVTQGLAHTTCLIGIDRVGGWLLYRVYWRHDPAHGWRTCAARLQGIQRDANHKSKPCRSA